MRVKKTSLIITFPSTTEAMKMEKVCMAAGLPGRLIPVPREITAGCGLAWKAEPEDREEIEAGMKKADVSGEGVYILDI